MASTDIINNKIRFWPAALVVALFLFSFNACTVNRSHVEPDSIPKLEAPTPRAEKYGKALLRHLRKDYELDSESPNREKLVDVFNQLTKAAEVDHLFWNIYLLNSAEMVDVRAVYGNYIFVWSGVLDAVANDDELAGLLAWELSHALAHHTDPVQFTLASNVLFNVAEMATTIGLMVASQGAIVISGSGWMKWAYTEVADLDPLDREYSEEQERDAANIALLIISRTQYSPQALVDFWQRTAEEDSLNDKDQLYRLTRSLSPQERAAMLKTLILELPEGNNQIAKKPIQ